MTEPLPLLIESSIEIAWDYLNRTGELGEPLVASRFLSDTIELMVRRGERRRLMLANKAIAAYQQFRRQRPYLRCSRRLDGGSLVRVGTVLGARRLKSRFNQRSSP